MQFLTLIQYYFYITLIKYFKELINFLPTQILAFFARGPLSRSPASAAAGPDLNLNFTNNSFFHIIVSI